MLDAMRHRVAVQLLDVRTDGFGVELPVGFAVEVFGGNAANVAGGAIGVGDAPVVIEYEDAVGKVFDEGCKRSGRRGMDGWRGGADLARGGLLSHIERFRVAVRSDSLWLEGVGCGLRDHAMRAGM